MKKEEHQIQVAVFQWINLMKNRYPALYNAYAIPNGGSRNEKEAANLKAEGVKAGVLDVCLAYPSKDFHGLYIEHKTKKGELTKDKPIYIKNTRIVRYIREGQETWFKRLQDAGYCCEISRSIDESIDIFKWYLEIK
jgi:hypothetical protein